MENRVDVLRALYKDVWGNPKSLVSHHTVQYKTADGMKSGTRQVFELQRHRDGILAFGFHLERQLLVTQEYQDALQYFKCRFSEELGSRKAVRLGGFVVTGQPGMGKSLFLLYVLLTRMQERLPVALHTSPYGYYLINDEGVSFHENSRLKPLNRHERIWCLSDSRDATKVPTDDFILAARAQIIQAASPHRDRWHTWKKETRAELYVMDIWDDVELAILADLQGGQNYVSKVFSLASEWGSSPRNFVSALNGESEWEDSLSQEINTAAALLAQNPERALYDAIALIHESTTSPVLWLRPKDKIKTRGKFDVYVPNATRIVNAVRHALETRHPTELVHHFDMISRHSWSHNLVGYVFESSIHAMITSNLETFTWFALDGSSEDVSTIAFHRIISGRQELDTVELPFYYRPALTNYPGIHSALCTSKTIYAIQVTPSAKHTSAVGGLQKLHDELRPDHRLPIQNWHLLFASPTQEVGSQLARMQSEVIPKDSKWRHIRIGYFTPPRMGAFASLSHGYVHLESE